jgi:hypothetical protein
MERIRFSLGLSNMVVVKGDGKGVGGIAVLWRKGVNVILRNYSINIDVVEDDGFSWRFIGIYGEIKMELKHCTWKILCDLHAL